MRLFLAPIFILESRQYKQGRLRPPPPPSCPRSRSRTRARARRQVPRSCRWAVSRRRGAFESFLAPLDCLASLLIDKICGGKGIKGASNIDDTNHIITW